jgi:mono/diheme cytochrome c family protein
MKLVLALLLAATPAFAAPHTYELPPETAALAPGPNLNVALDNCGACHSAEYIGTQPRSFPNPRGFWQSEVVKMKAAYGAPIDDADIPKIVDYLVATYGK